MEPRSQSQKTLEHRDLVRKETLKNLIFVLDHRANNQDRKEMGEELKAARRQVEIDSGRLDQALNAYRVCEMKDSAERKRAMESARGALAQSKAQLKSLESIASTAADAELTAAQEGLRALNGVELLDLIWSARNLISGRI